MSRVSTAFCLHAKGRNVYAKSTFVWLHHLSARGATQVSPARKRWVPKQSARSPGGATQSSIHTCVRGQPTKKGDGRSHPPLNWVPRQPPFRSQRRNLLSGHRRIKRNKLRRYIRVHREHGRGSTQHPARLNRKDDHGAVAIIYHGHNRSSRVNRNPHGVSTCGARRCNQGVGRTGGRGANRAVCIETEPIHIAA